jgi:hypothetical protein
VYGADERTNDHELIMITALRVCIDAHKIVQRRTSVQISPIGPQPVSGICMDMCQPRQKHTLCRFARATRPVAFSVWVWARQVAKAVGSGSLLLLFILIV